MSKSRTLLDTGPIVALLLKNDRNHARAKELFATVPAPLITCESVLSEACYLLQKADSRAPHEVFKLLAAGLFDLSFCLSDHANEVGRLLKKYTDVPVSLADACLIQCATIYETPRILTFDSDFQIYRWGRNKSFVVL